MRHASPIEASARAFVAELGRSEWDHRATPFDVAMTAAMPPGDLQALWRKLEDDGGAYRDVVATRVETRGEHRIVHVDTRFERLKKTIRVVFDEDGKVAGLFYGPVVAEIDAKTRRLIESASSARYDDAACDFGPDMKKALPPPELAKVWSAVEAKVGRVKEIEAIELVSEHGTWSSRATVRFERERLVVKVVYDARDAIAGLFFVPPKVEWTQPPYVDAKAFEEREVKVGCAPALAGTLAMPNGEGPFPALVLVHGSGPADRDETVGGVKPFKDLAWGLASQGIAVLRYEKRTRQAPQGVVTQKEEVLDAAHEAIELLRATPGVDPKRVFLLGHSQGGYLAPRIATANPTLAGVVILAGPTRPLEEVLIEQLTYMATLDPKSAALASALEAAHMFKARVESPELRPDEDLPFPVGGAVLKGAYFLDVRGYEPAAVASKLRMRLFVLQGERDYQVTMRDFDGWKKALATTKSATLRTYPSSNHLFVAGTGKSVPSEYEAAAHVEEQVVADVAAWIARGR